MRTRTSKGPGPGLPRSGAHDHRAARGRRALEDAAARARVGRVIVGIVKEGDARTWVGVASFDPSYPGAFPFRVRTPGLAPWLFEAMRPYARPEMPEVQVVVEGDEALVERLLAHGGVPTLSIVHMVGDIPARAG